MADYILQDQDKCCGCEACKQICPQHCIQMNRNEEGFLYPEINNEKCIECGKCRKVCPVINYKQLDDSDQYPKAIGGWHKDSKVVQNSSSGGAFTLFAQYILDQNGYVFGCTLDRNMHAVHVGVNNDRDLDLLRKSKYVQSEIGNVYNEIYEILKRGRNVLFVGTPCQAAGLFYFMKQKTCDFNNVRHNLVICDFICHGVPSPEVFHQYIKDIEKKKKKKVITFNFRCKDHGWRASGLQLGTEIIYEDKERERKYPAFKDAYMNGFLDDVYLRKSCYSCNFKQKRHCYSDITLADFWGVNFCYPQLNNKKGTSLILIHNTWGEKIFDLVKQDFFYEECDINKALLKNRTITRSAGYGEKREKFFENYQKLQFCQVMRRHMTAFHWISHKLINIFWNLLEKIVKNVCGKIFTFFHINLKENEWDSLIQFTKFCMVGLSNTLVSYTINISILFLLRTKQWQFDYIIANLLGFSLSVLWAYHWNSHHVFVAKQGYKRSKVKALAKTYSSYAFTGIVLNNLLGTLWIHGMGIPKFISPLLNLMFTVPINFLLNKRWTYKEDSNKK